MITSGDISEIKNEIFTNGPVMARIKLYTDFVHYTGGIYKVRNIIFLQKIKLHRKIRKMVKKQTNTNF